MSEMILTFNPDPAKPFWDCAVNFEDGLFSNVSLGDFVVLVRREYPEVEITLRPYGHGDVDILLNGAHVFTAKNLEQLSKDQMKTVVSSLMKAVPARSCLFDVNVYHPDFKVVTPWDPYGD